VGFRVLYDYSIGIVFEILNDLIRIDNVSNPTSMVIENTKVFPLLSIF